MNIAIILPAYNEEITIRDTLSDFHSVFYDAFIYVVDNNSTDRTYEIAKEFFKEFSVKGEIIKEPRQGKGYAVRTALMNVSADYYILSDADSTYSAQDAKKLLNILQTNSVDIVIGDRHSSGDYKRENKRFMHNFGNSLVKKIICRLFSAKINDILTGLRVFNRRFAKNYPILSNGFELETEMTLHILDKRIGFIEEPISYKDRPEGSFSKINTFFDGVKIISVIFQIFRYYQPLQFFIFFSLLFIFFGLSLGSVVIYEFFTTGLILRFPLAILATGLMLCSFISFAIGIILDSLNRVFKANFELELLKPKKN